MQCSGARGAVCSTLAIVLLAAAPLALPESAAAESKSTKEGVTDEDINAAVENELKNDKAVPFNDIEVRTQAGVVTLLGRVSNLLSRDNAQHVAQTVRGVRAVVNRLEVKPQWGTSDSQLQKDVESALSYDPAADAYELKVSVKNGVVTLNGQVQSFAERDVADKVVRGVRGVRNVQTSPRSRAGSIRTRRCTRPSRMPMRGEPSSYATVCTWIEARESTCCRAFSDIGVIAGIRD